MGSGLPLQYVAIMDYISVTALSVLWIGFLIWTLKDGRIVAFGGLTDRRYNPKLFWAIFILLLFMSGLVMAAVQPNVL